MRPRLARLAELKESKKLDAFFLTHPPTLRHLSGYYFNFETGPSPFHLLPGALFVVPGVESHLVVADTEGSQLGDVDPEMHVIMYLSYIYEQALEPEKHLLNRVFQALDEVIPNKARVGVEANSMPLTLSEGLHHRYSELEFVDVSRELELSRMVKDPDEIAAIRRATRLCDIGQEAVQKYARPRLSELELFTLVRGEVEALAEKRVPILADLVSGQRAHETGGSPSPKRIEDGDVIISDLAPWLDGYWADTCNTTVVGEPTSSQKESFQRVKEALDIGLNALKPGVRANEVDRLMREHIAKSGGGYPHHSGHGVGVIYHEEPRIVPYNEIQLVPNMVIALEPAVYPEDYGLRLEHLVRVTPNGCEVLSQFSHSLGT